MSDRGSWNVLLSHDVRYQEKMKCRRTEFRMLNIRRRWKVGQIKVLPGWNELCRTSLSGATPSWYPKRTCGALPYPDSLREKHTALVNITPRTIAYPIRICYRDHWLKWASLATAHVPPPSDDVSGRPVWTSLQWIPKNSPQSRIALVIKKPKLNTIWLELIARVLNMLIGLNSDNYYSKVFIRVNYKLWNSTFWVVITPPNRHIASPLAMKERKIKINSIIIYNIMLIKKQFSSGMMI